MSGLTQDVVTQDVLLEYIQNAKDFGYKIILRPGMKQTKSGIRWNGLLPAGAKGQHFRKGEIVVPCSANYIDEGMLPATAAEASTETLEVHVVDEQQYFPTFDDDYALSLVTITLRKDVVVMLLGSESWDNVKATPYIGVTAFLAIGTSETSCDLANKEEWIEELFMDPEVLEGFRGEREVIAIGNKKEINESKKEKEVKVEKKEIKKEKGNDSSEKEKESESNVREEEKVNKNEDSNKGKKRIKEEVLDDSNYGDGAKSNDNEGEGEGEEDKEEEEAVVAAKPKKRKKTDLEIFWGKPNTCPTNPDGSCPCCD